MRALFDVNALLALFDSAHVHHSKAQSWWQSNMLAGWASCPITQNGFVRVLSQPRYPKPRSTEEAVRLLRKATGQTDHSLWPDDISLTDAEHFDTTFLLGPNQTTDVYLLGLAVHNGGCLVTFDVSLPINAVHGAEQRHLVVL